MWPIFVLLWKHLLVRKRRYVHTPIQITSTIWFLVVVNLLGLDKGGSQPDTYSDDLDRSAPALRVLYSPSSPGAHALMDEVGAKLGLPRLDHVPGDQEIGYAPFEDEKTLANYTSRMQWSDAIVIFKDEMNEGLPYQLKYTIRMNTDTASPIDWTPLHYRSAPHYRSDSFYEAFTNLQWALDTSYLHQLTGLDCDQALTLEPASAVRLVAVMIGYLVTTACMLSHFLVFTNLITTIIDEKNTGIQELLKMVGVSVNTVLASHFINALPSGLVYSYIGTASLKATIPYNALVPKTGAGLIMLALLLHHLLVTSMAIFFSTLINASRRQATIATVTYMMLFLMGLRERHRLMSTEESVFTMMPPHGGLWNFFGHVTVQELFHKRTTFEKVYPTYLIMLLQTIVFFLLGLYIAHLLPGAYGQPLPWNYLCKGKEAPVATQVEAVDRDERYFEPPPSGRRRGIQIIDVTMKFPQHVALSHVNLDVLQGEITVLLGHNGAGKTTLMNIITGMLTPTSGRVLINDMDTRTQSKEVRAQLGLCPQHNLYYSDLSVLEHTTLFAMLKGVYGAQATESCKELLKKLNLDDKFHAMVHELSGGMKRRVQLACALAGGASVLVLDEPTSGLDVETRRELWDILLNLRGDRTVLLTTHFMEEADVLGDRIAALHTGQLKCNATPMFLKRAIGTGYRLTFTTVDVANEAAITALIRATIPGATVRDHSLKAVSYELPAKDSQNFSKLFSSIEEKRKQLGIDSMGIGQSTLDEVFIRLCTDLPAGEADQATSTTALGADAPYEKVTGARRYAFQFHVLIKRQFFYMMSKKCTFFALQVAVPFIFVVYTTIYMRSKRTITKQSAAAIAMDLDLYKGMPHRRVMYNVKLKDAVPVFRRAYKDVEFDGVPEVAYAMFAKRDQSYLAGIELNDTHAKAVYSTAVRHAAPVAVNLVSNALAARLGGARARITTYSHPLVAAEALAQAVVGPKQKMFVYSWCICVALASLVQLCGSILLPCHERGAGTRHIHLMCGCPLALYWAVTYLVHVGQAALIVLLPACISALIFDRDGTIDQIDFLWSFFVFSTIGLLATCAMNNTISMIMNESKAANLSLAIVMGCGFFLAPIQKMIVDKDIQMEEDPTKTFIEIFYCIMSPHTMVAGAYQMATVALVNAWCKLNHHHCPNLYVDVDFVDEAECCASSGSPNSYFSMDSNGAGGELIIIIAQLAVYTTIVYVLDSRILNKYFGPAVVLKKSRFSDPAIKNEKTYVEKQLKLDKNSRKDSVLCYDIYKSFLSNGMKVMAVKGISFSVGKGECFGLLGVNGAGKSTTFKMLNSEEFPTHGTLFANGYYSTQRSSYMESFSYCGQFFGLDGFLTGRQNLNLLLIMRGLKTDDAAKEASSWINEIGLTQYADNRVETYSGGCSRRLAAAAALCQRTRTALLDEPTAGVDPAARRCVHSAVMRAKRAGLSIIIASHSMDEIEALCDRMCIMSGGQICALGTSTQLRTQHGRGFSAIFKLFYGEAERHVDATTSGADAAAPGRSKAVDDLEKEMHRRFDCALVDDRRIVVQFHINNLMPYSELFSHMEGIKEMFPHLIEDYSVTETTLEEVFLSFAKEAIEHKQKRQQRTRDNKREDFFAKWRKPANPSAQP